MLELLASQAAIALENARLHGDLESVDQARDKLLASLGHELRNSLAPVFTACELMAMRAPALFGRERLAIERQVKHMMRLVDDLLDAPPIARGKIELVSLGVSHLTAAGGPAMRPIERAAGCRVLVVDDSVDAAQLLALALETMGHAALVTHDGPSALAKLSDFQPDVALLDIELPGMDGFELARQIRDQLGAAAPRLIAVSGHAARSGASDRMFDEYLVKPVALERLERAIWAPAGGAARRSPAQASGL